MNQKTRRVTALLAAAALSATLMAPTAVLAGPAQAGQRGAGAKVAASSTVKAQRLANLKNRIANVLAARKARFDAAMRNLKARINRVSAVADRVEKAGGDVSSARTSISAAQAHMEKAQSLEGDAVAAFKAIPEATDRHAAFQAAKDKARLAIAELKEARVDIRAAAKNLREVVEGLRSAQES
jgi:hypothetical protein